MREVFEYIARNLVDEPDKVEVEEFEEDDGTVVIEMTAASDDMGKLIGRRGRIARALRQIARALGTREGVRTHVDIVDEITPEDEEEEG